MLVSLLLRDFDSSPPPCSFFRKVRKVVPFPPLYAHSWLFLSLPLCISLLNQSLLQKACPGSQDKVSPTHYPLRKHPALGHQCLCNSFGVCFPQKIIRDTSAGSMPVLCTVVSLHLKHQDCCKEASQDIDKHLLH